MTAPSHRPSRAGERGGHVTSEISRQISLAGLPEDLERVARFQFTGGAMEDMIPPTLFGALTVHSYESAGGQHHEDVAPAAAAVEFTAAAASVLDDLQDLDPIPGIDPNDPGAGAELVALFMALANQSMCGLKSTGMSSGSIETAMSILSHFEVRALAGQHRANQIDLAEATDGSMELATDASHEKSGSFGRLAAEIGAALATNDEALIHAHGEFGHHLAIIDQLQNDVAGVWPGGEASTDISLGRATSPLMFAFEVPSGVNKAADEVKTALRSRDESGGRDEAWVREALFKSGAVHYAWVVAAVHRAKAASLAAKCVQSNPNSRIADLLVA